MSPPEVWGPAVWTLFHSLAEKINEENNTPLVQQVFGFIKRICGFLPCPECSKDATMYLQRVKQSEIKTRSGLISTIYVFHNYVNRKKKKKLFNFGDIGKYKNTNLVNVVNQFITAYNTTGNMNLIAESFQRKLIITDFKRWLSGTVHMFVAKPVINKPVEPVKKEPVVEEPVKEEPVKEEQVIEQPVAVEIDDTNPIVIVGEESNVDCQI